MIANAIKLRQPLIRLNPLGGIRPMHIQFYFNTSIIRNLGPDEFELLINNQVMHLFTLPNYMTSIHDKNNWLFDLDGPPMHHLSPRDISNL